MSDLIDRQVAIEAVARALWHYPNDSYKYFNNYSHAEAFAKDVIGRIERLPSAQPEIIRCKDCLMHGVCRFELGLGLYGYCSQGKERTDE